MSWPHSWSRPHTPQSSASQPLSSRLTGEGSHQPTPHFCVPWPEPAPSSFCPSSLLPAQTLPVRPQALQCSQLPAPQAQPSWSAVLRDPPPPKEYSPRSGWLPSLAEASPLSLLPGQGGKGGCWRQGAAWGGGSRWLEGQVGWGGGAQCSRSKGSLVWPPAQQVPGPQCFPVPVPWEGGSLGPR